MFRRSGLLFIVLLSICALASACSESSGNSAVPSPVPEIATQQPDPTATTQPGRVVLVAPLDLDVNYFNEAQKMVAELASSSGMVLDVWEKLEPGDIGGDWKVVILLSAQANLNDLLAAAPGVQFIVVNAVGLQEGQNLNLVRGHPDQQAFIAGYITVLVAPDWRSMGLLLADGPNAAAIQEAFLNGAHYLCGRCPPTYSPYVPFPQYVAMPAGTDMAAWQAQVDPVLFNIIYSSYVTPEASGSGIMQYLAGKGLVLAGTASPPGDVLPRWAATVGQDLVSPLSSLWPDVAAGNGGRAVDAEIKLMDINPSFLTPGRQQSVEAIIQQLDQGWISSLTYSQPIQ